MAKRKATRKDSAVDNRAKSQQIAREARLIQIAFGRCYAHRRFLPYAPNAPLPQLIKTIIDAHIAIVNEDELLVTLGFSIEGRFDHTPDTATADELPLVIAANIEMLYSVESLQSFPHDEIDAFGQRESLAHAWPYWREYVSSTTARMGLPAMTIPLVNNMRLTQDEVQEAAAAN